MTYPEALRYLDSFINYEKRDGYNYQQSFNIKRMQKIAALFGNPQRSVKSIHVAGSKGKGSTCAITYSILKAAGFKVGLYTSPHLVSFRERIRVNDILISEEDVAVFLERIKSVIDIMKDDRPTFFEVYTTLAYLYFKARNVDFAVYETGLGGRLDATNVLTPLVSAITPISYEHTGILGATLGEIAAEKAGIIKRNSICVSAPQEKEALCIIEKVCAENKTKLMVAGRDILFESLGSSGAKEIFNVNTAFGEYPKLETGLLGAHQVINAATAIGIIEALRYSGIVISGEAIREGVRNVKWEGRLEVIGGDPAVVLDGAQNRASANALANAIRKRFNYKSLVLVLGICKDKDIKGIVEELLPLAGSVILTKANMTDRAAEPAAIKNFITAKDKKVVMTSSVKEAVKKAVAGADRADLILITGSLFVVGEAREIILTSEDAIRQPRRLTSEVNLGK